MADAVDAKPARWGDGDCPFVPPRPDSPSPRAAVPKSAWRPTVADPGPPELWWSPSMNARAGWSDLRSGFVARYGGRLVRAFAVGAPVKELPDDAILFVPAEPVDEKGRTPTYLRGVADGRNEERARVGRCGDRPPIYCPPDVMLVACELPAGHAGWHRDDRCEWSRDGAEVAVHGC